MTPEQLLTYLQRRGARLWAEGDRLRISAPKGLIKPAVREQLAEHKQALLELVVGAEPATQPTPREPDVGHVPLSFTQGWFWGLQQWNPASAAYNVHMALRLVGPLDPAALRRSLDEIVRRHRVLRTRVVAVGGEPRGVVEHEAAVELPLEDLGDVADDRRDGEALRAAESLAREPMDLSRAPILRAKLIRLDTQTHLFVLVTHHIAADAWSMRIFWHELATLYEAYRNGRPSPLGELETQYTDYAAEQNEFLESAACREQLDDWVDQLEGVKMIGRANGGGPQASPEHTSCATRAFKLSRELSDGIRQLCRRQGATLFTGTLAALKALLHAYTQQTDLAIGTAVSNRARGEYEQLIGTFANTLVLRTRLERDTTFEQLLGRTRDVVVQAMAQQDLPFAKLVEHLQPSSLSQSNPFFNVMFVVFEGAAGEALALPGLATSAVNLVSGAAMFDLNMAITTDRDGRIGGSLEYDARLFDADTVAQMLADYELLLAAIVAAPDRPISGAFDPPESQRQRLLKQWDRAGEPGATQVKPPRRREPAATPETVGRWTKTELALKPIWQELLGVERVERDDNFFDLGGHSLVAMRIVARVREELGVELPPAILFERPTLQAMAQALDRKSPAQPQAAQTAPHGDGERLPLSCAQERLWYIHQMDPEDSAYNIPGAISLSGDLDVSALQQSLTEIVRRHEALRTRFAMTDGVPHQVVAPPYEYDLATVDLRNKVSGLDDPELHERLHHEVAKPFDLAEGNMLRAVLFRLDEDLHVLLLSIHHIAFDGWSLGVFVHELSALYESCLTQTPAGLPELAQQYSDYARWQKEQLASNAWDQQLVYWKRTLGGAPAVLEFPTDHQRPELQAHRGGMLAAFIQERVTRDVERVARELGVTPYMVLLSAYVLLMQSCTGQTDITVGTPVAGRGRPVFEPIIGFFVNMLVLRLDLSGDVRVRQVVEQVRKVALDAFDHQDLPFDKLVDEIQPTRDLSRSPLFQVVFALQNNPSPPLRLGDLEIEVMPFEVTTTRFDLEMHIQKKGDGLGIRFIYDADLFLRETAERFLDRYTRVVELLVADVDRAVCELPLLDEREREQVLYEWNDTARDYPRDAAVHELFERQAATRPDACAVRYGHERMSYGELNAEANRLARHLQSLGVRPGDLVGVLLDRSVSLVVSLLGVLKAGGAYVPLDPEYPAERLRLMLEDTGAATVLTKATHATGLSGYSGRVCCLDELDLSGVDECNLAAPSGGDQLAYVMFTSGSTGRPKGVCVEHRAINRLVINVDYVELGPADRVAQVSNSSFDAATFEVWGALLNGACLEGVPRDVSLSPAGLAEFVRERGLSVMFLTTALFNQIARNRPDAFAPMRCVLFGGEAVDPVCVRAVLESDAPAHLLHVYGPTENTTFSTWHEVTEVPADALTIPVGKPISNSKAYILDRMRRPAPLGAVGELYVGGDGLARGYWDNDALTRELFVDNPYNGNAGARLYRTGDLARYRSGGAIEFVGRADNQVKVRGYRVEPDEIESTLRGCPGVEEVCVLAMPDGNGANRLVAYGLKDAGGGGPTYHEVVAYLKTRLPEYMLPSAWVLVDRWPLNANGKIDRAALPKPQRNGADMERAGQPPASDTERLLASIWQRVLEVDGVDVHDNFFDLGGHSLLAMETIASLEKQTGVRLNPKEMVLQTLGQIAATVDAQLASQAKRGGFFARLRGVFLKKRA